MSEKRCAESRPIFTENPWLASDVGLSSHPSSYVVILRDPHLGVELRVLDLLTESPDIGEEDEFSSTVDENTPVVLLDPLRDGSRPVCRV